MVKNISQIQENKILLEKYEAKNEEKKAKKVTLEHKFINNYKIIYL